MTKPTPTPKEADPAERARMAPVVTTVRLTPRSWLLLRELAAARALAEGTRPNTGAVIAELVEREARRRAADREH